MWTHTCGGQRATLRSGFSFHLAGAGSLVSAVLCTPGQLARDCHLLGVLGLHMHVTVSGFFNVGFWDRTPVIGLLPQALLPAEASGCHPPLLTLKATFKSLLKVAWVGPSGLAAGELNREVLGRA